MLGINAFRQTPASGKAQLWAAKPEENKARAKRLMALVDDMPAEFRALVHEHGFPFIFNQATTSKWSLSAVKLAIERRREAWALEMLDLSDLGL